MRGEAEPKMRKKRKEKRKKENIAESAPLQVLEVDEQYMLEGQEHVP